MLESRPTLPCETGISAPVKKLGVIGLGGLGHMGVKFGRALGAQVTMITSSEQKGEDARMLGAHEVLSLQLCQMH